MFSDAGQIMDDDDDARRSQKFVLTIIRVIILVALISYAIWILLSAFASTKRRRMKQLAVSAYQTDL